MIAEYERAKMLERSRRGKRHKARQGVVDGLGGAPYGYRYIPAAEGGGSSPLRDCGGTGSRDSAGLRLGGARALESGRGQTVADRRRGAVPARQNLVRSPDPLGHFEESGLSGSGGIWQNPLWDPEIPIAGAPRPALTPRSGGSVYDVPAEDWVLIPVPAIVSEDLFATVQTQLEDNRR